MHLVPFWTVISFTRYERYIMDRATGQTGLIASSEPLDFSYTISAVADDHWCRYVSADVDRICQAHISLATWFFEKKSKSWLLYCKLPMVMECMICKNSAMYKQTNREQPDRKTSKTCNSNKKVTNILNSNSYPR